MPLAPGTTLGPMDHARLSAPWITELLGAAGMGEVYLAADTRLGRGMSPSRWCAEVFAADAKRMARFEREAQVLSSLNHPHIASIDGVEGRALVM